MAKNDLMIPERTRWFRPLPWKFALCVIALACPSTVSFSQVPSTVSPPATDGAAVPPASTGPGQVAKSAAEQQPVQSTTSAERLIDEAIRQITRLNSVAADLVQTVEMLNQRFTIKGRYLKAPDWRIYLQLTVVGTDETKFTTLQVCDGETLWDFQRVLDSRAFTRLAIKPILERLGSPELDQKTRESTTTKMGFAGADSLLVGLRKYYKFNAVEKEGTLADGKPVWILEGTWARALSLLGPDIRPLGPRGAMPPYIPGVATLYLGKTDYWPYKLVLAGEQPTVPLDTRRRGLNGEPIGARSSIEKLEPTKIVLTYSDVKLNATIPDEQFRAPTPPGAAADDRTGPIIKDLDQAISLEVDRKKHEAVKVEEPLRVSPIEIEIPPTAEPPAPR
jgi:outer membrane lipoprotein-sorting protein